MLDRDAAGPGREPPRWSSFSGSRLSVASVTRVVTVKTEMSRVESSQLGPLARPGPEAAVEIVIAECSAILLWPF